MNFPRYWAKATAAGKAPGGRSIPFVTWRWSNNSLNEAQILAQQAAQQVAAKFSHTGELPHHYGYLDRPLREEVLRELKSGSGENAAVLSRNSYGSTVLNCPHVLFLDIDTPEHGPARARGIIGRIFGKRPAAQLEDTAEKEVIEKLKHWLNANQPWNFRLYRTRAGFRIMATHDLFHPEIASSNGVFDALGVDPLYRQLCKVQKCFRARLSPKPWRCGSRPPPGKWPWPDFKREAKFREWQRRYDELSRRWATCAFVGAFGSGNIHPEIEPIIKAHDESTRAQSKLPLA